ncbi:MAG: serine/threonine-protein phosphatase [Acidobacteria bacterium]|nr:serine/threonine-protein phosphatase [Acidobacteriota bacterium]
MKTEGADCGPLNDELQNFLEIARSVRPSPGEVPQLEGVTIAGVSRPLYDETGGDHVIYLDFRKRYDLDSRIARAKAHGKDDVARNLERMKSRAAVLVADVAGHNITDGLVAGMLHQAFLLGSYYELDINGHITTRLFEHINTRFFESTNIKKLVTMVYGEIGADGTFRYVSAGHPPPAVFSREFGRFVELGDARTMASVPIGLLPSRESPDRKLFARTGQYKEPYQVNDVQLLGAGDVLLLYTDGLSEHDDGRFFPAMVEPLLARTAHLDAQGIAGALMETLLAQAPPTDDVTFVVVKKL